MRIGRLKIAIQNDIDMDGRFGIWWWRSKSCPWKTYVVFKIMSRYTLWLRWGKAMTEK